ncbi:juvenile hormone acid O-methyltransferase [Trichonephila clavipes]|uniref:Juvenile hormone acid O-methyltransferase n=1 Tax=Trichonephila clavipes TaxID=2585209 RepID=A0A8X6T151_TRICX|nr:juvenile hormone acid O-methyltransferase [Trichonephila clavipes]
MQFGTWSGWVVTSIRLCGSIFPTLMEFSSKDNCTSHKSRLATAWLDEHSSDFSVTNWSRRKPYLNPIEHILDVLEQGVKGHHTTQTILAEL